MSLTSSRCREPQSVDGGRGRFSPQGLERLRATALANRPWTKTKGPTSPEGRARAALNGRYRQRGEKSRREMRAELAGVFALVRQMSATRRSLT
jgi:hypothetical protein